MSDRSDDCVTMCEELLAPPVELLVQQESDYSRMTLKRLIVEFNQASSCSVDPEIGASLLLDLFQARKQTAE